MLLLGASLLLIGILLFVAKAEGDGSGSFGDPGSGPGARPPSGNWQPAPMVPNTPITSQPGGSPINDAPDITIVHDVRETMRRLPDRQTPKGWSNPRPTKRRNKG
jgi:hypothetical protein